MATIGSFIDVLPRGEYIRDILCAITTTLGCFPLVYAEITRRGTDQVGGSGTEYSGLTFVDRLMVGSLSCILPESPGPDWRSVAPQVELPSAAVTQSAPLAGSPPLCINALTWFDFPFAIVLLVLRGPAPGLHEIGSTW